MSRLYGALAAVRVPVRGPGQPGSRRAAWLRRLLWSVLAVVVALALVFFSSGGWYFAGQIPLGRAGGRARHRAARLHRCAGGRGSSGLVRLRAIGSQYRPCSGRSLTASRGGAASGTSAPRLRCPAAWSPAR